MGNPLALSSERCLLLCGWLRAPQEAPPPPPPTVCLVSGWIMDIDRLLGGRGSWVGNHQSFRESPSASASASAATSALFVFAPGTHYEAGNGTQLGKALFFLFDTHFPYLPPFIFPLSRKSARCVLYHCILKRFLSHGGLS